MAPVAVAVLVSVVHVGVAAEALVEYSSFRFGKVPVFVQAMSWLVPTAQRLAAVGLLIAVIVPLIANWGDSPFAVVSVLWVTRTPTVEPMASATGQT